MKRFLCGLLVAALLPGVALAQSVKTRTSPAAARDAVIAVPSTGASYPPPNNSTAEAQVFVQVDGSGNIVTPGGTSVQTPKGYQQIVGAASSTALTVPSGSTSAVLMFSGGDVRMRDDGVAPTASVGFLFKAGYPVVYAGSLSALRLIQTSAAVTVDVLFYQ